jgi:hypothetical protein
MEVLMRGLLLLSLATACSIDHVTFMLGDGGTDAEIDAPPQGTSALIVSDPAATVLEDGTSQFTVALSAEPAADVIVAISSSNDAKATVSPATLPLDATNWNTPQDVSISGVQDGDMADELVTVALTSAAVASAQVAVSVLDDDTPPAVVQLQISPNTLGVVEGMQEVFQVRLSAQPGATVTVNLASNNTGAVSVNPATLTFTTSDWNTYQNVVTSGVQDNNLVSDSADVTVSSPGLNSKTVMVTTTDNDSQALVVSQSSALTVGEGATATFTVRLAYQPTARTTVSVAPASTTVASVSNSSLSFTTSNWNTAQSVAVSGAQDTDYTHDSTTVTVSSTGLSSKSFSVSVPDNDLINVPSTRGACRGSPNNPIPVKLNGAPPGSSLTVNASASGGSISPTSLTFTSSNYATVKNFNFDPNDTSSTGTVTLSASGQASRSVSITIIADCF